MPNRKHAHNQILRCIFNRNVQRGGLSQDDTLLYALLLDANLCSFEHRIGYVNRQDVTIVGEPLGNRDSNEPGPRADIYDALPRIQLTMIEYSIHELLEWNTNVSFYDFNFVTVVAVCPGFILLSDAFYANGDFPSSMACCHF